MDVVLRESGEHQKALGCSSWEDFMEEVSIELGPKKSTQSDCKDGEIRLHS